MQNKKDIILNKFLEILQCSQNKCNRIAFYKTGLELNIDIGEMDLIFPRGVNDIIPYYFEQNLQTLSQFYIKNDISIREKIKSAISLSFSLIQNKHIAVRKIFRYMTTSSNVIIMPKYLYNISDTIWNVCNIYDSNLTFYTRRASLSALYSTCFVYFIKNGYDEGFESFVAIGVEKIAKIGKIKRFLQRFSI